MILSGTDPPGYELVPLREGVEFTLYRGRQEGNQSPVLVMAGPNPVKKARKPQFPGEQARNCLQDTSAACWALLPLFAIFCGTLLAETPAARKHSAPLVAAYDSVPLARVDTKMIRLPLVDGRDIRFRQIP